MKRQPDKLQKNVDDFLKLQKRKRIISPMRDQTILKLIENTPPIDQAEANAILTTLTQDPFADVDLAQAIHRIYLEAINELNQFNNARRLFALETINFLGNPQALKITAETTLFSEEDQLAELAWSFLKAFKGTDEVIAKLLDSPDLFDPKSADSQKYSLNNFRFDLAAKLSKLLTPSYLQSKAEELEVDPELTLDLLRSILQNRPGYEIKENHITGSQFNIAIAEVISYTQAHRMMPVYAKKRYDFLRFFLQDLTIKGKFEGIKPQDMAKVVVCFLYSNDQLKPPKKLITGLTDAITFDTESTQIELNRYTVQLAPSTIDALLKDIRDFLSKLLSTPSRDLQKVFAEIAKKEQQGKKDNSILGRFFRAMNELKGIGIMAINSVTEFIGEVVEEYKEKQASGEIKGLEEIFNEAATSMNNIEEFQLIAKSPASLNRLKEYRLVQTNVVGVRGECSEAGKRALASNLQMFESKPILYIMKKAFLSLFDYLKQSGDSAVVINEFKHPQAPKHPVQEYYTAFLLPQTGNQEPLLFCLGIGYFEQELTNMAPTGDSIADQYMDPYAFLMTTRNEETVMNARSRKLIAQGDKIKPEEYKALNLRVETYARQCYAALLDVLHLIPFNQWESTDTQTFLRFLYETLGIEPAIVPSSANQSSSADEEQVDINDLDFSTDDF